MTFAEIAKTAARFVVLLSAVPVAVGVQGFRTRPPAVRLLWGWLCFGLLVNVVISIMSGQGKVTALAAQITLPVFGALGLWTTASLTPSRAIRRGSAIGMATYLLFWGWRLLEREASGGFSVFTAPVLWLLLTLAAVAVIAVRLAESPPSPMRDPVVITAIGVLISYAPAAALEPVSSVLYAKHRDLTLALWFARTWLVAIGYLLFTLVFLWTRPPRSSPGSSSSVA